MAKLLGIHVRNYRALADFSLGQVVYSGRFALPRLACLIGPNGSGKSTVLDAFGFVADCLLEGVEAACDKPHRGGFDRIRTQGATSPIQFEIFFEADDPDRPIVYAVEVDLVDDVPSVVTETLRQRREGQSRGKPYYFLKLEHGNGKVWAGQAVDAKGAAKRKQDIHLAQLDKLGIATLGNLAEHPRIVALRNYIEKWYLSYFVPDAARRLPAAGAQPSLDRDGSNVGNVLQYYQRQHPSKFKAILERLTKAVPGLVSITPEITKDKRLLLRFGEQGYTDTFYQQSMSDGTLKMLAYATLLEDPEPRPFIGIEEPENGLYVKLVEQFARQLSGRTIGKRKKTQILVTTHSPYFVDALKPEQVWLIRKGHEGHATATCAEDMESIRAMYKEGIPLGSLWYSNHFEDGLPE